MRRVVFSSVLDATVIRRSGPPPPAREAPSRTSLDPVLDRDRAGSVRRAGVLHAARASDATGATSG
jgi:hypothetical protein